MAEAKAGKGGRGAGGTYRLELVGFRQGDARPGLVVQTLDRKNVVTHSQFVGDDGSFTIPADVLKNAHRVVVGAMGDQGEVLEGASRFRASEFPTW
jgi:hypothetical protein